MEGRCFCTQPGFFLGYTTLSLESEEQVVHPTVPLKSEFKVVESISFTPHPTLSFESVKTEVVNLTQSSSLPSLPVERK